jgi:hypothetical protein
LNVLKTLGTILDRIDVSDTVSLRRLVGAIQIHRGLSWNKSIGAVEDILNENFRAITVYRIIESGIEKMDDESRDDAGAEVWNVLGWSVFDEKPEFSVERWLSLDRFANFADNACILRTDAVVAAGFDSLKILDEFILKASVAMQTEWLIQANDVVDYLLDYISDDPTRPAHNTALMKIAIEVQKKYWPEQSARPKQEVVIAEIQEHYGLTEAEAKAVERVACPVTRKKR